MDPYVPSFISIMFIVVTLVTFYMIYFAVKQVDNKIASIAGISILLWLSITAILATSEFYLKITDQPARFFLAAPIVVITILSIIIIPSSRTFTNKMSLEVLTYLSAIRIPVELVLWWLYMYNQIPQVMTFEGRNFDIIAGITAPIIAYFVFTKQKWDKGIALAWNFICLALLMNIVVHAFLSFPFPFQVIALDNPNWGLLYFPYIWLPAFVAPAVLFAHLVSIVQLLKK